MDLVKRMQVGKDMEISMFDHVKRLKDQSSLACHVYDSQYYKVLTIACYDTQVKDDMAQTPYGKTWI